MIPKKKHNPDFLKQLYKEFGEGSIMFLGETPSCDLDVIPVGNVSIDRALGIKGFPKGRIVEIIGPNSSGKTTLSLTTIANCQKQGGRVAFIDVEHAFDKNYAINLGVDQSNLLISQPDCGEQALRLVEALVKSGDIDMIVVDSVAALTTRAEIEGEIGDALIGQHARMMSSALRKLVPNVAKHNVLLMFTNQIRNKIGVMFGSPETTPGGEAMKFYTSIRIDLRTISKIKVGENLIGSRNKLKVIKNKVAPPFNECEFDIIYGKGICNLGSLIDEALKDEVLEKKGSWIFFQGQQIAQGREGVKEALKNNEQLKLDIERKICQKT